MPISGLVLVLSDASEAMGPLCSDLVAHGAFIVGPPEGTHLPVVLETGDRHRDRLAFDWLRARPEVCDVQIAFIHFDAELPPTEDQNPCA